MKVDRPRARSSAAPTRLKSWLTRPICAACAGTKAAHLRQQRDQRVLPQEGRLARHVRPGQQPDRGVVARGQVAVVGDERLAPAACSARSTTGWRPPVDVEGAAVVDHRARPVLAARQDRQGRRPGRSPPAPARPDRSAPARSRIARASGRDRDASRSPARGRRRSGCASPVSVSVDGGEAHLVGGGLAVDEGLGQRRGQHPFGMGRRRLDEIAQHVVVLDLQALMPVCAA